MVANGGITNFADVKYTLEETGVDGVMSSECILENPALFTGEVPDLDEIAEEYLEMVEKYPGECYGSHVKKHLFTFLYTGLTEHTDLRNKLGVARSIPEMAAIA